MVEGTETQEARDADDAIRHRVDLELARNTARQIDRTLIPQVLATSLVVIVFHRRLDDPIVWWWGGFALANVVRGVIVNQRNKRGIERGVVNGWPPLFNTVSSLAFGAIWGALVVIASQLGSPDDRSLAVMISLAAMTLSAVVTAGSRRMYLTGLLGNVGVLLIGWAAVSNRDLAFGALIVLYFVLSAVVHSAIHRTIRANTASMYRNELLAARLSDALARQDPLTQLLNRDGLMAWIERAAPIPSSRSVAVAVGNVERLSAVNELFGAEHGDTVLATIGARLSETATPTSAECRLAGDEFAIVQLIDADTDPSDVAHRLLDAAREPFHLDGQEVDVAISTAFTTGSSCDVEQLVISASAAVRTQRSKRTPSLSSTNGPLQDRRELIDELQLGLDNGTVTPWFQPIVDCRARSVIAWEALARWIHPTRGVIPPMQFLGLVELGGFTDAFTDRMLDDSVHFVAGLRRRGHDAAATVHVNLTAGQARRADLVDTVTTTLRTHGVPPSALTVEMTEQDVPDIDEQLIRNLQLLEELGIGLAIDDFGTGYSSLSHLLDLRVTELKIDKRFVDGLPEDRTSAELVRGILGLAHGMGLFTVAEGVETRSQAEFLSRNGCDSFQGFLTSPALPAADALAFLARTTPSPSSAPHTARITAPG